MRKDKAIAIKLRKEGFSYTQIKNKLNIPKSTLSYWLRDIKLSKIARKRIAKRVNDTSVKALIKRNKQQTVVAKKNADTIRELAKREARALMDNKLFLVGVALYWAEGYKKGAYGSKWKSVDFANSDPEMIKLMMVFFRKICKVENSKIKIQVIAHKNIKIDETVKYWAKIAGISKRQFIKTHCIINKKNKRKGNTLPNGTVHIRINDVKLFFRIIGWVEYLKDVKNCKNRKFFKR